MSINVAITGRCVRVLTLSLITSGTLIALAQLPAKAGQTTTLGWDAGGDTNVAGYKIYSGTVSHHYTSVVTVGNVTQATITGLVPGQTYYYAATTVATGGIESDFSNETSYTAPEPVSLVAMTYGNSRISFTVSGTAGQACVVQVSGNLQDWFDLQTNTAPFVFADTHAGDFARRFYRTRTLSP